jgi:HAE1 family hydrophobic/amphiphilic exporter-1
MVYYKSNDETNGQEALILEIMSHREVGMVPMSDIVKKTLDLFAEVSTDHPDTQWDLYGARLQLISDSSEPVKETIQEVSLAVLVGAVLALIVLFLFMKSLRSSFIIFISVPLSTIICFLFMAKWEVGLNLMSLSGLALGIGMLVDNAIVVLESINRKREAGHSNLESSYLGSKEVIPAVIASTLTTVAVFFPLTFLEGNLGDLLFDQAFTVSTSLIISLFVAILLVPTFMALPKWGPSNQTVQPEAKVQHVGGSYEKIIRQLMDRPLLSFLSVFVLFGLIYFSFQVLPSSSMPQIPIQRINADIKLKSDLTIEDSHAWAQGFMNELDLEGPSFKTLAITGEATQYARVYGNRDSHELQLAIEFDQPFFDMKELRGWMSSFERWVYLKGAIGVKLRDIPAIDLGLGETTVCDVVISNSEESDYRALQDEFSDFLRQEGAMGIHSSTATQKNEILIIPDSLKLKEVNISLNNFNQRLKAVLEKSNINGFFPEYDGVESSNMLKIIIERQRRSSSLKDFSSINIGTSKRPIFLGDVATLQNSLESKHIYHLDGRNVLRVQCHYLPDHIKLDDIKAWFEKQKEFYPDLDVTISEGRANMSGSLEAMLQLFALSLFIIIVIMAVQFESILQPFLVIFSIPMALAGSLILLWVTSNGMNIMSGIGIVILIGVAVNNAIVLVSTANQYMQIHVDTKTAIVQAAKTRLRPIIMTAFTTISGLLPLLWGSSASSVLKIPLAIAVIGGLFSSTILVLFILPSIMVALSRKNKA